MKKSVAERIEALSFPEPNSGCFLWLGAFGEKRGGPKCHRAKMRVGQRMRTAARVVYETFCGEIPAGLYVLHRCDNPMCVNPDHLWLGTHLDNVQDMVAKRRHHHGKGHRGSVGHWSKLSADQAREIIALRGKVKPRDLADRFGVSRSTISMIQTGRNWKQLRAA